LILLALAVPPLVGYFSLTWPLVSEIEFEAKGLHGDETIRITANDDATLLLTDTRMSREWEVYRAGIWGHVKNIRLHYLTRPKASDPPRILYIHNGIIKLYRRSLLGVLIERKDILNIDAKYLSQNGEPLFPIDSVPMGSVRGGITGWTGYYELYP